MTHVAQRVSRVEVSPKEVAEAVGLSVDELAHKLRQWICDELRFVDRHDADYFDRAVDRARRWHNAVLECEKVGAK